MFPDLPTLRGYEPRLAGVGAWSDHTPFAHDLVALLRPALLVELGTHRGESFFAFCQSAQQHATGTKLYAVDTWRGDPQAGFYGDEVWDEVERHRAEHAYGDFAWLLRMTFDEAAAKFGDGTIDLLHIDGLHTYEAVRHDWETWVPKVRPGGIVMVHDASVRHGDFGVWRLWSEVEKDGAGSFAFTHGWGLGVWRKPGGGPALPPLLHALLRGSEEERIAARRYYELHAARLRLARELEESRKGAQAMEAHLRAELEQAGAAGAGAIHERDAALAQAAALADDAARGRRALEMEAHLRAELDRAGKAGAGAVRERDAALANAARERRRVEDLLARLGAMARSEGTARAELEAERGRLVTMRRSLSWKLTLPFRAAARMLGAKSTPTPRAAAPTAWRWAVDAPAAWHALPGRAFEIKGWCLGAGGAPPAEVRALVGRAAFAEVSERTPRPDVREAAGDCGFTIPLLLPREAPRVAIQVRARSGGLWETLAEFVPRVSRLGAAGRRRGGNAHERWLRASGSLLSPAGGAALRARLAAADAPAVAVVMPVCDPPLRWLRAAVASVRRQIHRRWELCIADDASRDPAVREYLAGLPTMDPRIKVVFRPGRGNISAATNSALERITAPWTAFLDHDDALDPAALAAVALAAVATPEAAVIYTDEDKTDERGRRFDPHFKPAWSPERLESQNYLCHLVAARTDRLLAIGGLRVGFEGAQDWDLLLRLTRDLRPDQVRHIPRVLYQWRAIAGSTALAVGEKSGIATAGERALRDHFAARGEDVELLPAGSGHWLPVHRAPADPPLVSIIMPTRDQLGHLRRAVESVAARTDWPRWELLIVDNQSSDPATLNWMRDLASIDERVRVLRYDEPFNYAALHNWAVPQARGEILCLLNNDVEVITPHWLRALAGLAQREGVGAVGARLWYPDGRLQHGGVTLGVGGVAGHALKLTPRGEPGPQNYLNVLHNVSAVTAACLAVRRVHWDAAGGMDAEHLAVAFNDVDFCLRLLDLGLRNVWTPAADLYHHESVSRGHDTTPEKAERFRREVEFMRAKWGARLDDDPWYSPHLSLEHEDFRLAPRSRAMLSSAVAGR